MSFPATECPACGANIENGVACWRCESARREADLRAPKEPYRKAFPICSGVVDYFPDALVAVAEVSRVGNEQHNPGQPLKWDRSKSADEADALLRHMVRRGKRDTDGLRHTAKVAWRALALLQKELESEAEHKI